MACPASTEVGEGHPRIPNSGGKGHQRAFAELARRIDHVDIRELQHEGNRPAVNSRSLYLRLLVPNLAQL
eukprot:9330529-Pyramimonas_sp.AAC.1